MMDWPTAILGCVIAICMAVFFTSIGYLRYRQWRDGEEFDRTRRRK